MITITNIRPLSREERMCVTKVEPVSTKKYHYLRFYTHINKRIPYHDIPILGNSVINKPRLKNLYVVELAYNDEPDVRGIVIATLQIVVKYINSKKN